MQNITIMRSLDQLYIDYFRYNDFQPQKLFQFKQEAKIILQPIENCNVVFQYVMNIFQKKILHLESKLNFDCYNSLIFELISERLVVKPKIFETLFFPNQNNFEKILDYISNANQEIYFYNRNNISQKLIDIFQNLSDKQIKINIITEQFLDLKNCNLNHKKNIGETVYAIIDGNIIISGSFTWDYEDINNQNAIIVENETLAKQYIENFEKIINQSQIDDKQCQSSSNRNKSAIFKKKIQKNYKNRLNFQIKKERFKSKAKKYLDMTLKGLVYCSGVMLFSSYLNFTGQNI